MKHFSLTYIFSQLPFNFFYFFPSKYFLSSTLPTFTTVYGEMVRKVKPFCFQTFMTYFQSMFTLIFSFFFILFRRSNSLLKKNHLLWDSKLTWNNKYFNSFIAKLRNLLKLTYEKIIKTDSQKYWILNIDC
jgi:hypothetical protein